VEGNTAPNIGRHPLFCRPSFFSERWTRLGACFLGHKCQLLIWGLLIKPLLGKYTWNNPKFENCSTPSAKYRQRNIKTRKLFYTGLKVFRRLLRHNRDNSHTEMPIYSYKPSIPEKLYNKQEAFPIIFCTPCRLLLTGGFIIKRTPQDAGKLEDPGD